MPAPDQLRALFRAITEAVELARGGKVLAEIECKREGGVLRWRVLPAWITGTVVESGLTPPGQ